MTLNLEYALLIVQVIHVRFLGQEVLLVAYMERYNWEVGLVIVIVTETLILALCIDVTEHLLGEKAAQLLKCLVRSYYIRVPSVDDSCI